MGHKRMEYPSGLGVFLFLLLIVASPFVSLADTGTSAGFAPSSIWMSRAHAVAGESVNILTVLYNSSDNSISGDVIFLIDNTSVGTKNFTLAPGETQILSAPWIAKIGNHTASARIEKATGVSENISVLNQTTGNITVSIGASPPPSPAEQVLNTVTSAIQTGVASSAPAVLGAANALFNATESLRAQAKSALEKQLAKNVSANASSTPERQSESTPGSSTATGTSTKNPGSETSLLSKMLRYMAAAGLVVVSSKTLFYISLALMLFVLIKIMRAFLRERRRSGGRLPID